MKIYEKDNQVYEVQEGSAIESKLIADGFKEVEIDKKNAKKNDKKTEVKDE